MASLLIIVKWSGDRMTTSKPALNASLAAPGFRPRVLAALVNSAC